MELFSSANFARVKIFDREIEEKAIMKGGSPNNVEGTDAYFR